MVTFNLTIQLEYTLSGRSDFVFNFHPANTRQQRVSDEYLRITPATPPHIYWMDTEPESGNRIFRVCSTADSLTVSYEAVVDVQHHFEPSRQIGEMPVRNLSPAALRYVYPSRYCQSDALPRDVVAQFAGLPSGYSRVLAICDWVRSEVRFQPASTNSSTSALDTLRDRVGVCRDFAHLMIALCRAVNVPARFVTGIDYGADPALGPTDFHAYVETFLDGRWYIFDPSGIAPVTGLLRMGTGRDASDVAFATIFGSVLGGAPKIHIEASPEALAPPAGHAVSTSGERSVAATRHTGEIAAVDGSPRGWLPEDLSAAAACQVLSYTGQLRPTVESAERR